MRHSKRMGQKMDDVKRVRHVERRHLKRCFIEHQDKNPKSRLSLKQFAKKAMDAGDVKIVGEQQTVAEAKEQQKVDRLRESATFWLNQKKTKQVRVIHPKRTKVKVEKVKVQKTEDKKKRH